MFRLTLISLFALVVIVSTAQPATEIYLFDVKFKNGKMTLSNPQNISNHPGYDNQPFFHPEKSVILYTSADDQGKTDIKQYDYRSHQQKQLTQTNEKEYSPTITPDDRYISCIVQRENGAQDLAKYPIEGGGTPQVLISDLVVGYHTWLDENTVFVFTLPAPFQLQKVDLRQGSKEIIAEGVGRSIRKIPGQKAISYTKKVSESTMSIMSYNSTSSSSIEIAGNIQSAEIDMCWTSNGKILRTDATNIYIYDEAGKVWNPVTIKSNIKLGSFSRIAISNDGKKLALVVTE